ncbi:NAD(P)-dependent oxidoreductase [Actinacidiphila acidipaludis]|uniref:NAD(P)H-binding protein n=1 Tax=Actinacidiphila acidipaludis TaxID=2873382 RepID=A0ABS7QEA4_9ACTN|nr:NAD(P)H-binding protein [Streptomyces acidipaludis]MBY8881501.1 NAD(P)H-binding protein [Streptomyces acidipaludis]
MNKRRTVAVLGATGMVGSRVVDEIAARGHRVLALSRRPADGSPLVTPVAVDASDSRALRDALEGRAVHGASVSTTARAAAADATARVATPQATDRHAAPPNPVVPDPIVPAPIVPDAVVVTVRTLPPDPDFLVATTRTVLDCAARHGMRVLVVGGAGALRSPDDPALLAADDPRYVPPEYRTVAEAGIAQLRACQAHGEADWVYLSPPADLRPGERTGRYRRGAGTLLTTAGGRSWISAEDLAVAVADELVTPGVAPGGDRHFTVVHRESREDPGGHPHLA